MGRYQAYQTHSETLRAAIFNALVLRVGAYFLDLHCARTSDGRVWCCERCDGVGEAERLSECVWRFEGVGYC
jgi:hypothetical protein